MGAFLITALWTLAPAPVLSPSYAALVQDAGSYSGLDRGTAQRLRGTIKVLNLFVSDRESAWSEFEMATVRAQVRDSLRFIKGQAQSYGVRKLNFIDTSEHVHVAAVPADYRDFYWTDNAIERATGKKLDKVFDDSKTQGFVLIHINRPGQSSAMPVPFAVVERAVLYRDEIRRLPGLRPSSLNIGSGLRTYAHEILHLFGAPDLYAPKKRAALAERVCPRDIMLAPRHPRVRVCAFTARRVGW